MAGKWKALQQLNLLNNKLVGSIPEGICNLSKLEEIYLGNNQLMGEIPKKMGLLLNLKVLSFPVNNLTGSIPATIFNISSLLNISLSNKFFFSINFLSSILSWYGTNIVYTFMTIFIMQQIIFVLFNGRQVEGASTTESIEQ